MKNTDAIEVTERNNEITIAFLWDVLRHRLIWLILAVIIGAGGMFGYIKLATEPTYSSEAEFAVENTSNKETTMSSAYQTGAALYAESYAHEITRNRFLEAIAKEYNARFNKSVSATWLAERVTTATKNDLPVFTVKVTSTDAQEAYDILTVFEDLAPTLLLNDNTKAYVNVKLIHYGHKATTPNADNMLVKMMVAGAVAFLLMYVIFFLRAYLDKTIYTEETLKQSSDLPVVGQIPEWLIGEEGLKRRLFKSRKHVQLERGADRTKQVVRDYKDKLLSSNTPFSVSESFKTLRTNLTYVSVEDTTCPVFSVTSDFSGAGKSLVLANLAISFAQLGKRVLLIDGDMRCPTQYKIFSIPRERKGLSEALAGLSENPLEDCVTKNAYEGMDVMIAGRIPPNPSELLSSERMKKLLVEAKKKYDYIFIDLPPVLETADAGVVAPLISAYVLVARAGYSNIDVVLEAVEAMRATSANVVGFVLNDVNTKNGFGYYSYGRYSKYGRYAGNSKYARYSKYSDAARASAEQNDASDVEAR